MNIAMNIEMAGERSLQRINRDEERWA